MLICNCRSLTIFLCFCFNYGKKPICEFMSMALRARIFLRICKTTLGIYCNNNLINIMSLIIYDVGNDLSFVIYSSHRELSPI